MSRAPVPRLTLRRAVAGDEPFLRALHAETRAEEMAATGWPEAMQTAFLAGQFDAQQRGYRQHFPDAAFDVVLAAGRPVGRLYVAWLPEAVHVVNIVLAASCRGRGWGTALLGDIIARADRLGVPVGLHVEDGNRARRLYLRLGFQETGREGFYRRMERPVRGASPGAN